MYTFASDKNIAAERQPPQQPPTAVGTPGAAVQQSATAGCSDGLHGNNIVNGNGNRNGNSKSAGTSKGETAHKNQQSLIETLEPYDMNTTQYRNKRQRSERQKQNLIREAVKNDLAKANHGYFPKYFTIKFPGVIIEEELDNIKAQREITQAIGQYDGSIKKHSKDTLLIKVRSKEQGDRLKRVTTIAAVQVVVAEHAAFNQTKGTIYSKTMVNSSIDSLKEALKDQHVIDVERMKIKINGTLKETPRHILTFNIPDLPGSIKLTDWHRELVEPYIPRPMRCTKCWRFGHTWKHCRREKEVCAHCAEEGHQARSCENEARCANCSENHPATDKKCPALVFKSEVIATQVKLKSGYKEAEDDVKERFHATGRKHTFRPPRQITQRAPLNRSEDQPNSNLAQALSAELNNNLIISAPNVPQAAPNAETTTNNSSEEDKTAPKSKEKSKSTKNQDNRANSSTATEVMETSDNSSDDTSSGESEDENHQDQRNKAISTQDSSYSAKTGAIPKTKNSAVATISAPSTSKDTQSPIEVINIPLPPKPDPQSHIPLRYDPWEDTMVHQPSPPPPLRPPPGANVANLVKEYEDPKSDLWKLVNSKKNKNIKKVEKTTKRQEKRKLRSMERENKKPNLQQK